MEYLYPILDMQITLRCNSKCLNCIKFCNMKDITGLDYSDSDMTMGQIDHFIEQIKSFNRTNIFETIFVTGGEPFLHSNITEIIYKLEELQKLNYFKTLLINSNKIISIPNLDKYVINYSLPKDNKNLHNTVLLHPTAFGGIKKTYTSCNHYRKNRVVLNYMGYSICCAGDAYIRLFNLENLILDYLPNSSDEFPIKEMNLVCEHCPFGNDSILPLERNLGRPVSEIYKLECDKNKIKKRTTKRFPE